MSPVNSPYRRCCAVLLGGLIVWQLVFILAANLLPFVHTEENVSEQTSPERERRVVSARRSRSGLVVGLTAFLSAGGKVLRTAEETLGHWSNLTGQLQGWSLYAPFVPTQATFIAVELRWDDAANSGRVVRLPSAIEPSDPRHYFRPFCTFRLPAYEANLGLVMWAWDEEEAAREPELWRQRLAAAVRRQWKPMRAYLRWRLASFEAKHPETAPPTQVILLARIYRMPSPDQPAGDWSEPVERPIARWRPGADVPHGCLPLESYNPATNGFDRITRDE